MKKSRIIGTLSAVVFSFITLTVRKIVQTAGAVTLVALFAGSASAALLNSGFESPDASGGDVAGTSDWTTFENVFTNNTTGPSSGPVSHADNAGTLGAGTQSLKTFGPFQGPPFKASGVFQDVNSVVAGQAYELAAWVMNWIGDPFQNLGILRLQFWDGLNGTGTQLGSNIDQFTDTLGSPGFVDLSVIQDGAEVSDWTRMAVTGIAPAGTQSATIFLAHIQTGCVSDPCKGGSLYWDDVSLTVTAGPVPIAIDIKPGSDPVNPVNPESNGVIPVAVLGSMDFDATQVDFSTVEFGPGKASPVHDGHVENVNGDGFDDMVFHFNTQDTGITCGDTEATLLGETFGGDAFTGTDSVKTAGCK